MRAEDSQNDLPSGAWLSDVREVRYPLTEESPIWVRHVTIDVQPAVPFPERHPFCELGLITRGGGTEFVGPDRVPRGVGDLFLAGPGLPHWFEASGYPLQIVTVFFLPSVLIELGSLTDGGEILRRFCASQPLSSRQLHLPGPLRDKLVQQFEQMAQLFEHCEFGRDLRLRLMLGEILLRLISWERQTSKSTPTGRVPSRTPSWDHLTCSLQYLHAHFKQTIYGRDVARASGISESRLNAIFRQMLGTTWLRYLKGYRIRHAIALLNSGEESVLDVALEVGFESLSNFNPAFQEYVGMSPSAYLRRHSR